MESVYLAIIALVLGFVLDQLLGDPVILPHPIVGFGKAISFFEKKLNKGNYRFLKGGTSTILLVAATFYFVLKTVDFLNTINPIVGTLINVTLVFYSLSAFTLRKEVKLVFDKTDVSIAEGRKQLSRIVGRDTEHLDAQKVRCAALETLSENLSDGVIAPLFWFLLLGVPGMMAYKMVNTLDSMIGYKTERFLYFGKFAAKFDDFCNFIPARLTSLLMLISAMSLLKLKFVVSHSKNHSSPNSGYPEAALAAILNCRFGGANQYFGQLIQKPYIGINDRKIVSDDIKLAISTNLRSEWLMLLLCIIVLLFKI